MLFSHKMERNPIICDNTDKPRRHCTPAQSRQAISGKNAGGGFHFSSGDLPHPGTATASLA